MGSLSCWGGCDWNVLLGRESFHLDWREIADPINRRARDVRPVHRRLQHSNALLRNRRSDSIKQCPGTLRLSFGDAASEISATSVSCTRRDV